MESIILSKVESRQQHQKYVLFIGASVRLWAFFDKNLGKIRYDGYFWYMEQYGKGV